MHGVETLERARLALALEHGSTGAGRKRAKSRLERVSLEGELHVLPLQGGDGGDPFVVARGRTRVCDRRDVPVAGKWTRGRRGSRLGFRFRRIDAAHVVKESASGAHASFVLGIVEVLRRSRWSGDDSFGCVLARSRSFLGRRTRDGRDRFYVERRQDGARRVGRDWRDGRRRRRHRCNRRSRFTRLRANLPYLLV